MVRNGFDLSPGWVNMLTLTSPLFALSFLMAAEQTKALELCCAAFLTVDALELGLV